MARMMIPFRRAMGYSFDTKAFLEDNSYAQVILQLSCDSQDPSLRKIGQQLKGLLPSPSKPNITRPSAEPIDPGPPTWMPTELRTGAPFESLDDESRAEQLRNELLRKYQGSIR